MQIAKNYYFLNYISSTVAPEYKFFLEISSYSFYFLSLKHFFFFFGLHFSSTKFQTEVKAQAAKVAKTHHSAQVTAQIPIVWPNEKGKSISYSLSDPFSILET